MNEKKPLTEIVINIQTPDRGHAIETVRGTIHELVPMVLQHPEACIDIHVCPEEVLEKKEVE